MTVREYIGARYVPLFIGEWDDSVSYEPLSIVIYQGDSYTSRQYVPIGIDIDNETYWACTGNYNAQVEQYRQEVLLFDDRITANATAISEETTARENADTTLQGNIDSEATARENAITAEATARENADTALQGNIDELAQGLNIRQSQFDVSPILLGSVVYSKQNSMYDHPGCICNYGDTQYLFSSPESQSSNAGHCRTVSIVNNQDNYASYQTLNIGHANSAAYDTNDNKIYLAPVFDYSSGTQAEAHYICKFSPGSTSVTNIATPEWCMAVSFDNVSETLYILAYGTNDIGKIYKFDESDNSFELVKSIERDYEYNQDFAIRDGKFCISSPSGYIFIGTLDTDEQTIVNLSKTDSSRLFVYGELDGMEFDANGHLLALAHSDQLDDRPTFIYELPIFDDVKPMYEYVVKNLWNVGTNYTLHVNQTNTALRTDGYTAAKGLKSFNFVNLLADLTQRSILLDTDYTCENFRIGNDVYNWISLSNHTLRVTDTCTIQTPVIINGGGTFRISKPIVVTFGLARIGFAGNVALTVDTGTALIATSPAGTFVTFGSLSTITPTGLKLYSTAAETIDDNQIYILGSSILTS